jgi:hypothetical protein
MFLACKLLYSIEFELELYLSGYMPERGDGLLFVCETITLDSLIGFLFRLVGASPFWLPKLELAEESSPAKV